MSSSPRTAAQDQFRAPAHPLDTLLAEAGRALQVLTGSAHASRPNPAGKLHANAEAVAMSAEERRHAAGLMRVNHVGEICAQALYRGQAIFARDSATRELLHTAAAEEVDHLVWCRERLRELESRPSYLNPLWYAGSFSLGALAGCAGSPLNLGFMAETEAQVERHLSDHLEKLPLDDHRSRSIVEQMRDDEAGHRRTAEDHGAVRLPFPVRMLMRGMAKVMTTTAYRV